MGQERKGLKVNADKGKGMVLGREGGSVFVFNVDGRQLHPAPELKYL